jgi:hypothetical protein
VAKQQLQQQALLDTPNTTHPTDLTFFSKRCRCERPGHCSLELPWLQQLQRCTAHHQQHLPLPAVYHLTLLLLLLTLSCTAAAAAAV